MSTVIYQGHNSYLESRFNDNKTLWLKLSSPKANISSESLDIIPSNSLSLDFGKKYMIEKYQDILNNKASNECKTSSSPNLGGWNFVPALSQSPSNSSSPYVHPLVKKSMFPLSEKSLEMCTENLGNESGTDIVGENISFSCLNSEVELPSSLGKEPIKKLRSLRSVKKTATNFPPPLTTRREGGSESLHIIPKREDGKLVLEAVRAPSSSCLRAERSSGSLRLFMIINQSSYDCDQSEEKVEEEINNEELEEEHEENFGDVFSSEDMDRNKSTTIGTKLEKGKFQRPYMCKEVGCRKEEVLLNLESFWVATS